MRRECYLDSDGGCGAVFRGDAVADSAADSILRLRGQLLELGSLLVPSLEQALAAVRRRTFRLAGSAATVRKTGKTWSFNGVLMEKKWRKNGE